MVIFILLIMKLIFSLFCGCALFYIFARIITALDAIPNYWDERESEFINREVELNNRMIRVLYQIGSPENSGRFSDRQNALWSQHDVLKKEYDNLFAKYIRVIVYHDES